MISDTLRVMVASTGALNPYAVEELMDARIAQASSHERHALHALVALGGGTSCAGDRSLRPRNRKNNGIH